MEPIFECMAGQLRVQTFPNRTAMGEAAAQQAGFILRSLLASQKRVSAIFAAAPSQNEFLDALCAQQDIDWCRVDAFHMDEYIGLPENAPQRFGNFLREHIFGRLPFGSVHYLNGNAADLAEECDAYAALLQNAKPDVVFMGIGENGHIAFNDPAVTDFNDPYTVKIVTLDEVCRFQQVHDGCFAALDSVPRRALTLTIPALLAPQYVFCIVPAASKAKAVTRTVTGSVTEECPASILQTKPGAILYLDTESGAELLSLED